MFSFFDRYYQKFILSNYKNVMDFAEKLHQVQNKLFKLDATYKIRHPHFVHKFFNGFSLRFKNFFTTFKKINSLILFTIFENQFVIRAVTTFNRVVMVANKKEKKMMKVEDQSSKTVAFMSNMTKPTDD